MTRAALPNPSPTSPVATSSGPTDSLSTTRRSGRRAFFSQGLGYSRSRLISDASYNLTLGQTYLAGLLTQFDGSYVLSIAGYNAGPHRVRRWLKEFGDPRTKDVDVIDWVEMIPFDETRNYVQRVMENLHVYRSRLAGTEMAFAPHADLMR